MHVPDQCNRRVEVTGSLGAVEDPRSVVQSILHRITTTAEAPSPPIGTVLQDFYVKLRSTE